MESKKLNFKSRTLFMLWAAWFIASVFYGYQYILRVMPSVMMQDLMQQFNFDSVSFGQFSGVYYIGYALMHVPLGILLDRYGPRKIMPACMVISVVGLMPIIFSTPSIFAVFGRCLIGIGSSGAILSAFTIIRYSFGTEKFTRILSFTVMLGLIGAIYGSGPINYMCEVLGYKYVTIIFAVFGIGLSIFAYLLTPNFRENTSVSILTNIRDVLTNKKVLTVCVLAGLMVGPLEGFADVWGKQFFEVVYNLESTVAASLTSIIFLGMCFGSPVLCFIASKFKNDLLAVFAAGILMTICFAMLLFVNLEISHISIMFVLVGVCCAYQILAIFKASTYVNDAAVGLTTSIANMIIMIFGYVFHSAIGVVVDLFGGISSVVGLSYGVAIIPCALLIGTLGFGVILWKEKGINTKLVESLIRT